MLISLIVARSKNQIIGSKGLIPWRLPADLAYFKQVTMGHHVLMGRKTFQSIGKPLPGRVNLVVSKNERFSAPGCLVFRSIYEAVKQAQSAGEDELFVMGGGEIYRSFVSLANKLYITEVDIEVEGDTHFHIPNSGAWRLVSDVKKSADEKNECDCRFTVWEKTEG